MSTDLFESVPNFSEGRDAMVIDAIAEAVSRAHLLDVHPDPDHHRTVVSVAGSRERVLTALVRAVGTAAERIDLTRHAGVHPRVGAADVVPIVPLGSTSMDTAHEVARELGERVWAELGLPVFFYGHGEDWTLADIRAGRAQPDLGGPDLHPTFGAVCIGARQALIAFNVTLEGLTVPEARALARSIRESNGGMRGVMALAFELPGGRLQLSMNLFRIDETSPEAVVGELRRRGVHVGGQEIVGLCPAVAAGEAASGRLLEARMGAAVAREGARRCLELGGEEQAALAVRLQHEASELADLDSQQAGLLAGGERCGALGPVLGAAGVLDAELAGLSRVAARGFRAALDPPTVASYPARVEALDRRLAAS
ncbi:MAG TPA: glutamate formiminotransferase [Candidatus Dormibacteraeota bacterium]|nr:glutamate formiminotransferase [Candidatus Dormibacteraeota bacterium]